MQTVGSSLERRWTPLTLAFGSGWCGPSLKRDRDVAELPAHFSGEEDGKGGWEEKEPGQMHLSTGHAALARQQKKAEKAEYAMARRQLVSHANALTSSLAARESISRAAHSRNRAWTVMHHACLAYLRQGASNFKA